MSPTHHRLVPVALAASAALLTLAGCGDGGTSGADAAPEPTATTVSSKAPVAVDGKVTVTNCGESVTFPSPARRLFANDGNIISIALAVGGAENITAVSSEQRDAPVLARHYGTDVVEGLNQVSKDYPSKETVLAEKPDVYFAGWNYGFDETTGLTPAGLAKNGIAAYTLTESCRQGKGSERGIVDPWTALRDDLENVGAITGHGDQAAAVSADIDARLAKLQAAPKPSKAPRSSCSTAAPRRSTRAAGSAHHRRSSRPPVAATPSRT